MESGRLTPADHDDVNVRYALLEPGALNELRAESVEMEIQQRIETEEAQKQGATHIYDPNQKKAVPVGTWIQRHFQGMPGVKP